jgi:hypothetical protein
MLTDPLAMVTVAQYAAVQAFMRHQAICTGAAPGGPHGRAAGKSGDFGSGPSRMATGGGLAQKPHAFVCYLCGQQYGSSRCALSMEMLARVLADSTKGRLPHALCCWQHKRRVDTWLLLLRLLDMGPVLCPLSEPRGLVGQVRQRGVIQQRQCP